ncbi:NADH:flavin oxidoreductase [Roseovarius aestuarii]|uniref:Putative N-methylproline demethylase n=1 Tax=Roseovarius aestuarii TaxID=475083 RepID=A0A1X7BYL7_9RHOB|nr:NADH:flavin oxidoreductase [Roseovarius aestuarii]SMC14369.1 putative N-methylproline demethylase [Roseovarius aestuarii]
MNAAADTSSTDPLLQPFQLGHLKLRNRIMSTSHAIGFGEDGMPTGRYQRYHEAKAQGGIGLTMFGGSTNVSRDSANTFGQLSASNDRIIPYFQKFADRIHKHGAALMCQLTHLGGRSQWRGDNWLPTISPSRFREPLHRGFTKEMQADDIARVIKDFGQAAQRCYEGGLDGCELHIAGHLIGQFWSPATNQRRDDFGGSLENRARFGLMVLEEIRRVVPQPYLVGVRMAVGEGDGGVMPDEDYLMMAEILERSGLIDFFNFTYGRIDTEVGLARYMPGMALGLAPQLRPVANFQQNVGLPVFHAARINDMATARYAVREGHVDLIGMTRAHIADPHIARKLSEGAEETIRPCVGATYCSWHGSCIHNPAIGREDVLPHVIENVEAPKRVTVVGAGPGGLEAARVAAERGHTVTLMEAAPKAGGQILLASKLDLRRDLIGIVDWRVSELERLGATVRYNVLAGPDEVAETEPDTVIIATGGVPDRLEDISGAELGMPLWEALEAAIPPEGNVIFYDGTGTAAGLNGAHTLATAGASLTYVTPDRTAGVEVSEIERPLQMRAFYKSGATLRPDLTLRCVERDENRLRLIFENSYSGETVEMRCDTLIYEHGTLPVDTLYLELAGVARNHGLPDLSALTAAQPQPENDGEGFDVYRIGDATSSRDIHAAILDAARLCARL